MSAASNDGTKRKRRKNNEGSWGEKNIKGVMYKYYRSPDGKYFYGKTNKEINEKRKVYEAKQADKILTKDEKDIAKETFGNFMLEWLLDLKRIDVKRNTIDGYEACINGQVLKYKGSYQIAEKQVGTLKTYDFQQYYASMADVYSRGTIKKNYAIVTQCIRYGNKRGYFAEKIDVDEIKIPNEDIIQKKKREIHFLTENDVKLFCQEARRVNTEAFCLRGKIGELSYGNNANLLMFLIFSGLRISEAIELKWGDVDFKENYFTVNKNAAYVKDRSDNTRKSTTSSTKTKNSCRIVPLNKNSLEILRYEETLNPHHTDDNYIFITQNGDKIKSRQNVNRTLKNIMLRTGCSIPYCTVHELRHTFGSLLIKKGVDVKVVSELLGHKDVSTTYNIYIHILNEQKVSALTQLDDIV